MMPLSTALGCSLSAVTAAFAAVADPMTAAVAALAVFGAAGARSGAALPRPGPSAGRAVRCAAPDGPGDAGAGAKISARRDGAAICG